MARGRSKNGVVAAGLVLTAAAFAAIPYYFRALHHDRNLTATAGPLSSTATMRGPFLNSGSKDVGRDEDWQGGVWVGRRAAFTPSEAQLSAAQQRRRE